MGTGVASQSIVLAASEAQTAMLPCGERRKLAFAIVSLFQSGGLQRDCIAIAEAMAKRGHLVTIFTSRIRGQVRADVPIVILPIRSLTNHGRNAEFACSLAERSKNKFDVVVGFDKLSGLDILYCADPCILESTSWIARIVRPRYRTFARLEGACFQRGVSTRLILLSPEQASAYRRGWQTEPERITVITPLVNRSRRRPELRDDGTRAAIRAALGINREELVLLAVGGQPHTKGLDRVIRALPTFPSARLLVAGIGVASARWHRIMKLADKLGVGSQLMALGIREDIPQLMAAADSLVHVARRDTTGTVIIEAIVNGLPVIATAACGFSSHVRAAGAGIVLEEPYDERDFISAVHQAEETSLRNAWSARGVRYGEQQELYSGIYEAVKLIEQSLSRTANSPSPATSGSICNVAISHQRPDGAAFSKSAGR